MLPAMTSFERKPETLEGRVAFRSVTSDRMPMIGALADETAARADATRLSGAWPLYLPRTPGLYGAFAFVSRGLVWSTLAAELIAAQIEGEPWPIERELAEAVDPARFLLRALRQGASGKTPPPANYPPQPVDNAANFARMTCVLAVGVNGTTRPSGESGQSCSVFTLWRPHLHDALMRPSTACKHWRKQSYPQKSSGLVNYYYVYINKTCKP